MPQENYGEFDSVEIRHIEDHDFSSKVWVTARRDDEPETVFRCTRVLVHGRVVREDVELTGPVELVQEWAHKFSRPSTIHLESPSGKDLIQ